MKCTKKNFKIRIKISCGHCVEHMAGNNLDLTNTSLSSGFWAKPLLNCDDVAPLHLLHQCMYLPLSIKVRREHILHHVVHMPATFALSFSDLFLSPKPCPVHSPGNVDHHGARPERVQGCHWPGNTRPEPCQCVPIVVITTPWTRQSVAMPHRLSPLLHPYLCVEQRLPLL
jgi:hypothetical protein